MKQQQSGFIAITAAIFIALILGIGGTYYVMSSRQQAINEEKPVSKPEVSTKTEVPVKPLGTSPATNSQQKYVGAMYIFWYPTTWMLNELNPANYSVVLFPKSKSAEMISKKLPTNEQIRISHIANAYVDLNGATKLTLNTGTWYVKNVGKTDGSTESTIEYYYKFNDEKYVLISTGISNKQIAEDIASTWYHG